MTNSQSAVALNPITFPLSGSRLIEASAGTGKTFTIALLYTRLVLGQDLHGNGFHRPLTPREILVVTFTDLAAGELRDRIRARLVEAASYFRDPQLNTEELLVQLRDSYAAGQWPGCAWRLQMAAEAMDEASVSTIHSWCNRMLVEHAFDTRGLFDRELVSDSNQLLTEVVQDYWRSHFYPLSAEQIGLIRQNFATPEQLEQRIRALLQPSISGLSYMGQPVDASFQEVLQQLEQQLAKQQQQEQLETRLRQHWADHWPEISEHLLSIRAALNGTSHGSSNAEKFTGLLQQIHDWAAYAGPEPGKLRSFASNSLRFKKGQKADTPVATVAAAFDLMQACNELQQQPADNSLGAMLLAHAGTWVKDEFDRRMQHNAQMSFDDLLVRMQQALCPQRAGEHAEQLAATLKRNFPVAMIDEFQDTDPIQFQIFERIYQPDNNADDCGLFMIGDPKQSIYSFRGADIHTYLQVRKATTGRHYTLAKNFRSTREVVQACNAFFSYAEQHPQGAFGYKDNNADNQIPFIEVQANHRADLLWQDTQQVQPMTLWYLQEQNEDGSTAAMGMNNYRQQAGAVAASQIAAWLNAAASARMGFGQQAVERPLKPADIAILVRSASEAQIIARALQQRGIASVYLSDRESLLCSQEAADVLLWLRACAEPSSEPLVRAALASHTLNLPLEQLLAWQDDELQWEQQAQQFYHWQRIWQRQGVLVMLQQLLEFYQLPARLLAQASGERSLTNLLHLAEWLQQAATRFDGQQALIRHLAEHLNKNDEQALLRLESDAQRVKILTIHKSKGLEFALVVLPFICSWREVSGKQQQTTYLAHGQRYLEVAGSKLFADAWQQAEQERIREDLRLLYVALTRASHALWLGVAPLKSGNSKKPQLERSAIGQILQAGTGFADADAVYDAFAALAGSSTGIQLQTAPVADTQHAPAIKEQQLQPARQLPQLGKLDNWWIASYSRLSFGNQQLHSLPEHEPQDAHEDQLQEISNQHELPDSTAAGNGSLHQFPRGAKWGTFLHGLLEWAAQAQSGNLAFAVSQHKQACVQMLERRCKLRNITAQATLLGDWLEAFVQQKWQQAGFSLSELAAGSIAVELEFFLEIHQVNSQQLDQLISSHTLPAGQAPKARQLQLNGLLKGFIDLVVEHQGRYYIIDWKSNYLGSDDSAYDQHGMQQAIIEYRYDVQYMLYILALHRHLRDRLPDYDYARHMGGAIYCFLRGWQNPDSQGLFYDCPPQNLIEQLDQLFSQGATA